MLTPNTKIFVAGHRGMVGSAVVRELENQGYENLLLVPHGQLNLVDQDAVRDFFAEEKPQVVIMAAARVGGIHANSTYPAQFIYDNLAMALNTVHAAYESGVERFLFLGSSCIYPKKAPQPMREECLLTSELEPTNEPYAIAKIAGLKLCEYYRKQYGVMYHSLMPTNLYGPGDNYHPENSHVLPALIRRFHEAKESGAESVTLWGSGKPCREFLHVSDLATAVIHMLQQDNPPDWVNVGTGKDCSILELAQAIQKTVGYKGKIELDPSKPDGTARKLLDITLIKKTGWEPKISLKEGLAQTYENFLRESTSGKLRE